MPFRHRMYCKSFHMLKVSFVSGSAQHGVRPPEICLFSKNVSFPIDNRTIPMSCRDRCFKTTKRSSMLECMCDPACMFIGDCCYDYLLECDPRSLNISVALREQFSIFYRFDRHSDCVTLGLSDITPLKMVNTCPKSLHNSSDIESMCTNAPDKSTISSCIPVESGGVLYRNIYCDACHGLPLHQLHPVASYEFIFRAHSLQITDNNLLPFFNNINCRECKLTFRSTLIPLVRFGDACWCHQALPDRSCNDMLYVEDCNAYSRVVYDKYHQPYNNEMCKTCDNDGEASVSRLSHCESMCGLTSDIRDLVQLFDFTSKSSLPIYVCKKYYKKGQSFNPCLLKQCQVAFEAHDDICMSGATAKVCYSPKHNRHKFDYLIANLFRSAIIIQYKAASEKGPLFSERDHWKSTSCTHLPAMYNSFMLRVWTGSIQCAIVYFDTMVFAKLSGDLSIRDISKGFFPDLDVLHTMLLNHDPLSGISCSSGARFVYMEHMEILKDGVVQGISQESKLVFISNKDPLVMTQRQFAADIRTWAIICKPRVEDNNCSAQMNNENSSSLESCLKYELTGHSRREDGAFLLTSGKVLRGGEFILTKDGTILVCAYLSNQLHEITNYVWFIVVTLSYMISLIGLMTTFIIFLRYRDLRTLPGLMLMNLIVALFVAQLLFLLNAWDLFENDPVLCLIMTTAQHYFWLASFTWMGCMSLDIFRCFSIACTTVNTYSASKYVKYALAGWVMPLPFPLAAIVLTSTTSSSLAYSTSDSCWMANTHGVLYLFAIPVFTTVALNTMLFTGSVYRLYTLLANASFVGRKEDMKHRLIQCIKLSSWMGISWLFGIIPNIVGIDTLWYLFVITNALQGLHIFFAFGVSGRARVLMKDNFNSRMATTTASSRIHNATRERETP